MKARRILLAMVILAGLFLNPGTGYGESAQDRAQPIGNAWKLCDFETARVEAAEAIPARLLKAISLAETGRWNAENRVNFAWPWTVTALGQGHYFSSSAAALDFVRRLQSRGITNIDVGCMQVNLFYHGGGFATLEDAIDPATNVAYGATYLKGLYRTTRSWTQAAAYYHSTTPGKGRAYKLKVLKYWNAERRLAALVDPDEIDRARMAELNNRFRDRAKNQEPAAAANTQMQAWRNNRLGGHSMATLAAMRRAGQESEKRKHYLGDKSERTPEILAAKRRGQIDKWRRTWKVSGISSGG